MRRSTKEETARGPGCGAGGGAASGGIIAAFAVLSFFFLFSAVGILAAAAGQLYEQFGFQSRFYDFYFVRFLLFSILPFGFNAAFGAVFGMVFERAVCRLRECVRNRLPAGIQRLRVLGCLSAVIVWWLIFNLPLLLQGETARQGAFAPLHWPPKSFYAPVARELFLFLPMGTLGLFFGFFAGCLGTELRVMRKNAAQSGEKR